MKYNKRSEREKLYVRRIVKQRETIKDLKNKIAMMEYYTLYSRGIMKAEDIMKSAEA